MDLENLSKEQLLALLTKAQKTISIQEERVVKVEQKNKNLQYLLDLYRRMQFGQSRERFAVGPNQMELPFEVKQITKEAQEEVIKQEITYSREKKKHPGRAKLPDHLPVEEIEIHPEGDLSEMVCIGKETTDVLGFIPGHFKIKRYIRYKYATKDKDNA
ncbi:hypothetical protein LNQ81_13295 [Myroides sp. M-43]|uniref:IS66 family transposase n=1 Tax=Myroides oncorhynchi TaxID=2893756 RepID=UPI001E5CEB68|nr:hypothetical protein [Myroides oncorhynchi]MCC9043648.1 hypothetical protein [Myroides oncorhynchi]